MISNRESSVREMFCETFALGGDAKRAAYERSGDELHYIYDVAGDEVRANPSFGTLLNWAAETPLGSTKEPLKAALDRGAYDLIIPAFKIKHPSVYCPSSLSEDISSEAGSVSAPEIDFPRVRAAWREASGRVVGRIKETASRALIALRHAFGRGPVFGDGD